MLAIKIFKLFLMYAADYCRKINENLRLILAS